MSDSSTPTGRRTKLAVERLEDRTVPTFLPRAGLATQSLVNGQPFPPNGTGGLSIAVGDIVPEANPFLNRSEYVVGTGPGIEGEVRIFDNDGSLISRFVPFAGFTGGINVAVGDVIGDGAPEIIATVAANGPPLVGVFTPSGSVISRFFVAGNTTFTGGLNVAVGNVLGGIGGGFFGGGGQFKSEIIVGTAAGLSAVVVMDGSGNIQRNFFAFDPNVPVGVTVAASSVDSTRAPGSGGFGGLPDTNAYAEIIVGAADFIPAVGVFSVWQGGVTQLQLYTAFDPNIRQGVTVTAGNTDGNRGAEIYVGLVGTPTIRAFNGETGAILTTVNAFPVAYSRVVNMAIGNVFGFFDPNDPNAFDTRDLVVVAGDGPFEQQPRIFFGAPFSPAGLNGP